jgi:adenosine deaminase
MISDRNQQVTDAGVLTLAKALPKIELHRHLEGSIRLTSFVDIAREYGIEMPEYEPETLRPFVQMMPDEQRSSQHFLSKFSMIRQFYRSNAVIERVTREAVEDAADDNIQYMELRFTPMALANVTKSPLDEMVELVATTVQQTADKCGIKVRLIASMNRHEPVEIGEKVMRAAVDNRKRGVVGLDLAGDEANYSAVPFRSLFREAREEGLGITIHAGEWSGAASVWDAVGNIGATRVGHGIKVLDDLAMVAVLVEREIVLEVCPSSNYLSGIVNTLEDHPLMQLTNYQLLTTLNTDDPSICDVSLSDEIAVAMRCMGLTLDQVKQFTLRAARAAFLPNEERDALVRQFQSQLATF